MPLKDKILRSKYNKEWKKKNHLKVLNDKKKQYCKNPARHMQWAKEHKDRTKIHNRNSILKRRYGISLKEYNEMFNLQNGCCSICGKHQTECNTTLNVDHDHKTGKIRELLCWDCNTILGKIDDSVELLNKMIIYLNKYK